MRAVSFKAPHRGSAPAALLPNLGLLAGLMLPAAAWAQAKAPDVAAAGSVVRITCSWDGSANRKAGRMIATGFVWRDSRHVVTALHAAVGCKTLNVHTQKEKDSSPAQVVNAHLVADLALLRLDRDLGLPPIPELKELPDTRGEYYTWGYPKGAPEMTDVFTRFSGGLGQGVTTLEAAYGGSAELDDLFRGQTHPQRNTSILRVSTTVLPGQSGAPILDTQGRVVAIVDGGLLGGYLTMNWSIPAFKYLPELPRSRDPIPSQPSKWAVLFSETAAPDTRTVAAPADAVGRSGAQFHLVRTVTLADYVARQRQERFPDNTLDHLRRVTQSDQIDHLSFDVYEEPTVGTTIVVPSGFALTWNADHQAFETRSASGAVRVFVGTQVLPAGQPKAATAQRFADAFTPMADWARPPSAIDYSALDKDMAGTGGFVSGTDRATGKPLSGSIFVQLDYGQFIGLASFHAGGQNVWTALSKDDLYFYFMMLLSQNFTKFTVR